MKRRWSLIVIAVLVLLGMPLIVTIFSPWSRIHCRVFELDLVSGQQRVTCFGFAKVVLDI